MEEIILKEYEGVPMVSSREIAEVISFYKDKNIELEKQLCQKLLSIPRIHDIYELYEMYTGKISGVYFTKDLNTELTKIGKSKDILSRVKSFKTTNNLELVRIIVTPFPIISQIERELHNHYKDYKDFGEWYNLDKYDDVWNNNDYIIDDVVIDFEYGDSNNLYDLQKNFDNLLKPDEITNKFFGLTVNDNYKCSKIWKLYEFLESSHLDLCVGCGESQVRVGLYNPPYDVISYKVLTDKIIENFNSKIMQSHS